jgi:hypothetical protein
MAAGVPHRKHVLAPGKRGGLLGAAHHEALVRQLLCRPQKQFLDRPLPICRSEL